MSDEALLDRPEGFRRELFRFGEIWAAAGHPNGVFRLSPDELVQLTGAPVHDVVQ